MNKQFNFLTQNSLQYFFITFFFLGLFLYFAQGLLGTSYTLPHDNYYWLFPLSVHWLSGIINYEVPFFDFFSNLGVPFTTSIVMGQFLDPFQIAIQVFFGLFFDNPIQIFNLSRLSVLSINSIFVLIIISRYNENVLSTVTLGSIIFLSSFFLVSLRQNGFLGVYQWLPISVYFLIRHFENKRNVRDLIVAIMFLGPLLQAYFFSGVALLIIFTCVVHCEKLHQLLKVRYLFLILLLLPALPTASLIFESGNFIFPAREPLITNLDNRTYYSYSQYMPTSLELTTADIFQNYSVLEQVGVFGKFSDFITLISPNLNKNVVADTNIGVPNLGEAYYFYGCFIVLFLPLGFIYYLKHPSRVSLIFILLLLFYLGPKFGVHELIYKLFPPIRVFRHSVLLNLFIQSGMILFACKGLDIVLRTVNERVTGQDFGRKKTTIIFLMSAIAGFGIFTYTARDHQLTGISIYLPLAILVACVLSISMLSPKLKKLSRAMILIGLLINTGHLIEGVEQSKLLYEQPISFDQPIFKSDEEKLNSIIHLPAKLHSGCIYGTTFQAVRYPTLIMQERSVFSPPVIVAGQHPNDETVFLCHHIDTIEEMKARDTWNVLQVYKSYFSSLINDGNQLFEQRKYLIPDAIHRKAATKATLNAIQFENINAGLFKTNLFYDESWTATCDRQNVQLRSSESVEFDLMVDCDILTLKYSPTLFIFAIACVLGFYLFMFIAICVATISQRKKQESQTRYLIT